jgi:hypothetical protein
MQNYDKVLEAQTLQTNSAGLAQQRYRIYLDSTEAATNRMTAAWEKLVTATASSDMVKYFLNLGAVFFNVVEAIGLFNLAIIAISVTISVRLLVNIPILTNAILNLAGAQGVATLATTRLASALAGGLVGIGIIVVIAALQALNRSIVDTYNNFEKLRSATDTNTSELSSLADEYGALASKQNKTAEDTIRLLDIQTILNTKYGASTEGINIYSSAIDNNSVAIQKNIEWIKNQAKEEEKRFLEKNKYAYAEAKGYLETATMGYVQGTPEEQIKLLDEQISKGQDIFGTLRANRDMIYEQVEAAQKLIIEYEHYQNLANGGTVQDTGFLKNLQTKAVVSIDTEKPIKSIEELQKALDTLLSELTSVNDQSMALITSYEKYGQVGLDQINQLKKNFGDEYIKALYVENGQIKLNTEALKQLVIAKAAEAYATATQAYVSAMDTNATEEETEALKQQLLVVQAYYDQVVNGSLLSIKSIEDQQKAYDDLLKTVIDMIKQQKEAEKQALQDQLNDYKDYIDERKQALEDAANDQKEQLQDELEGYQKIIQAEKDLLAQRQESADYQDKLAGKNKEISDIDAELLALQFDNSEAANARRLELEAEKTAKLKELSKIQSDYEFKNANDALDKELKTFEEQNKKKQEIIDRNLEDQKKALDAEYKRREDDLKAQIDVIDNYLKQSGIITSDAMALMATKSDAFYNSLLEWNRKFGDSIDENIIAKWNQAFAIAQSMSGMSFPSGQDEPFYGSGDYFPTHHDGVDSGFVGGLPKLKSNEEFAKLVKGEMVINSSQMSNFMQKVLPNLAGSKDGGITIHMPINVGGNLDRSVLPELKNAVLEIVNTALKNRGTRRDAFSYSL